MQFAKEEDFVAFFYSIWMANCISSAIYLRFAWWTQARNCRKRKQKLLRCELQRSMTEVLECRVDKEYSEERQREWVKERQRERERRVTDIRSSTSSTRVLACRLSSSNSRVLVSWFGLSLSLSLFLDSASVTLFASLSPSFSLSLSFSASFYFSRSIPFTNLLISLYSTLTHMCPSL